MQDVLTGHTLPSTIKRSVTKNVCIHSSVHFASFYLSIDIEKEFEYISNTNDLKMHAKLRKYIIPLIVAMIAYVLVLDSFPFCFARNMRGWNW